MRAINPGYEKAYVVEKKIGGYIFNPQLSGHLERCEESIRKDMKDLSSENIEDYRGEVEHYLSSIIEKDNANAYRDIRSRSGGITDRCKELEKVLLNMYKVYSQFEQTTRMHTDYRNKWSTILKFFTTLDFFRDKDRDDLVVKYEGLILGTKIPNYEEYFIEDAKFEEKIAEEIIGNSSPERRRQIREVTAEWNGLGDKERLDDYLFKLFHGRIENLLGDPNNTKEKITQEVKDFKEKFLSENPSGKDRDFDVWQSKYFTNFHEWLPGGADRQKSHIENKKFGNYYKKIIKDVDESIEETNIDKEELKRLTELDRPKGGSRKDFTYYNQIMELTLPAFIRLREMGYSYEKLAGKAEKE